MNPASDVHGIGDGRVLISGGGIAGLTLAILLRESGWDPVVIERAPAMRTEGYMMDFFGTGWDVAERMGLVREIREVRYPIDALEYVDKSGSPTFPAVPIERVRRAFGGKYTYLRRSDLERILFHRASGAGVPVLFDTTIRSVQETGAGVQVTFSDGTSDTFRLLFGADGVHSRVRELVFGRESQFDRFLGYYIAGFHVPRREYGIGRSLKIYEEPGRVLWCYPLDEQSMDAVYFFRHDDVGRLAHEERLAFVRTQFAGAGWIAEQVLQDVPAAEPPYFDAMTQIGMPAWQTGRIALLGDACGCLTPLAGQGSHMAMAGAYVLSRELQRSGGDHRRAFPAYERFLKPFVTKKQDDAKRFAHQFVPASRLQMAIRYPLLRMTYSNLFIGRFLASFGAKSILTEYA